MQNFVNELFFFWQKPEGAFNTIICQGIGENLLTWQIQPTSEERYQEIENTDSSKTGRFIIYLPLSMAL